MKYKVRANKAQRTLTIRAIEDGVCVAVYRNKERLEKQYFLTAENTDKRSWSDMEAEVMIKDERFEQVG